MGAHQWTKKKIVITTRTYPIPSTRDIEVSCTAGITDDNEWIRLFPVPYRFLQPDKRFSKYQCIEAEVIRATSDPRLESYKLNLDSIKILCPPIPSANKWRARKALVQPLKSKSLCNLQAERNQSGSPTLGFFKPKGITKLTIEPTSSEWTAEEWAKLRQYPLFGKLPRNELKKVPYIFKYHFTCDDKYCRSHSLSCTDWEMGASYHKWFLKYGVAWEKPFRKKYEKEMIQEKDIHFFVGTVHKHPDAWIIVGLFYPPFDYQLTLDI